MSDLRLFCVTSRENPTIRVSDGDTPTYFYEKRSAKALRDRLPGGKEKWQVSKGPDHRLYKGA